ncbi:MAG: threonylcarbamoyl-AMP synthase [Thermoleophilia bacterium]|nr:threonylcarbamoyl-AMP synthase [Thermoleophilia bacterium]
MLVLRDPAPESRELDYVRRALEAGELVVVPTDTVYGLAALASDQEAVARLYAAKGRGADQPTAVVYATAAALHADLPFLSKRASWAVGSLLPGPFTLIVDNPVGHLPWLTGGVPGPLGVRVPAGALALPAIAATSANPAGAPTARDVRSLDPSLQGVAACAVDRGELDPAAESTVVDLVAWEGGAGEPRILRDTAGRAGQVLAVLADAP